MTPRDPVLFLHDMMDSATFLKSVLADRTLEDYQNDRLFRSAVQHELMIIGEALYVLNKTHADIAEAIPGHQSIIAFRHILVHGYHSLNAEIVWSVLTDKLSPLIEQLDRLIVKLDPS